MRRGSHLGRERSTTGRQRLPGGSINEHRSVWLLRLIFLEFFTNLPTCIPLGQGRTLSLPKGALINPAV
jgi:hypothetical protein